MMSKTVHNYKPWMVNLVGQQMKYSVVVGVVTKRDTVPDSHFFTIPEYQRHV